MESKGVDNFLKGLISRVSDDKIADNAFSDCMNVDLSEKFLPKSVKGKIKVNSSVFANKPCQGMTIYNNKELGSLLIVACGGYIYYSPLNTDNFQKYKIDNNGTLEDVVIDENVRVRFAQYNDRLFVFTGKYPVIENVSFSDACILVLYKTSATFINRDSFYAWTRNGQIFYTLSATPSNGDVIFTDLYRSKLAVTVASYDSGTDKFTDSDSEEYSRTSGSDKVDTNIPKGLKIGFIHQERLFGLGSVEDDNGVYWSQPYDPTRWTPVYGLNYDTVGKDDGEIITGGASFGGAYVYIFKQHNVYRYLTSGDIDQWSSNKVDTTYGCVSHETIRLFNGMLTYLSPDGVAQLSGNSAVLIDEQINDKTTNVSVGNNIEIERRYKKSSNWDGQGSAITKGIVVSPNKIAAIQDLNKNRFDSEKEYCGDEILCSDGEIKVVSKLRHLFNPEPDSVIQVTMEETSGQHFEGTYFWFKISFAKDSALNTIKLKFDSKLSWESSHTREFVLGVYDSVKTNINQLRDNYIVMSNAVGYSALSGDWITFTFPGTQLNAGTYWVCIEPHFVGIVSGSGMLCKFKSLSNANNGSYKMVQNGNNLSLASSNSVPLYIINNASSDDCIYKSDEIDLNVSSVNLQQLIKTAIAGQNYDDYSIKLSVANYPDSADSWDSIDNAYKTDYVLTQNDSDTININNNSAYRYLRYKIEFTIGAYGISNLFFKVADNYNYESEIIPITGSGSVPKSWGISEIVRMGSDDAANKATVYMRSGNDQYEIQNATYYEIKNYEQISASIGLKSSVQFKVSFPAGSDNEIYSIMIFYYTMITLTKVCAFVWKDKYRLNMPANNESGENSVEYIYDKAGYWTIKDNENNFDYCASVDDLFSCSAQTGTVYKKEIGYKNDTENYNCFFVTKRFVLSDFENLYRKFKVRYVSTTVNVTVGVSVDDGEFVDYDIPKKANLIEVIKTLTGIVRGQTVRFRFAWQANDYTQIHNLVWYWKVLRHLNIG